MGWERALITDSGGFQVFSLAHGGVANEVKGSGRSGGEHGSKVEITEEGARFRSYRDGSELFISPEVSMRVQAALGSDIALVFDECTPFHADREYTARSTERTHRWLDRCLAWHAEHGPERQAVFGIVQGGVHEDLRRESAAAIAAAGVDGIAIGGTLGRDKEEMHAVLAMTAPLLPVEAPKHLLGIGEIDDLLGGIALGLDVFDCAVPTRLARHGVALAPDPEKRFRLDLRKGGWAGNREPLADGCPCPACRRHDRDYISYLSRAEELTAVRLIVLHNLTYMHELTTPRPRRDRIRSLRRLPRRHPRRLHSLAGLVRRSWSGERDGHPSTEPPAVVRARGARPPPSQPLFGVLLDRFLEFFYDLVDRVAGDLLDLDAGGLVGRVDDSARRPRRRPAPGRRGRR